MNNTAKLIIQLPPSVLSNTSELLGLESSQLAEVLTQRSMILRGEEISTPLTTEQVKKSSLHLLLNYFFVTHFFLFVSAYLVLLVPAVPV